MGKNKKEKAKQETPLEVGCSQIVHMFKNPVLEKRFVRNVFEHMNNLQTVPKDTLKGIYQAFLAWKKKKI